MYIVSIAPPKASEQSSFVQKKSGHCIAVSVPGTMYRSSQKNITVVIGVYSEVVVRCSTNRIIYRPKESEKIN